MSDYYEFIFDLQRFDDEPTEGDDNINNNISGATINALGGNDTIENSGDSVSIYGGAGADSIYNESSNATINGGTGNNTIVNDGGYGVLFQYGGGSDVIEGFDVASSDIQISLGSITSAYFDGSDAVLNIGNGSIRIKDFPKDENLIYVKDGAGNVEEFYIPMTITGTEQSETFDKDFNNVTIQALGGNDTVENSGANVLIDAGDGNDSIRNSGSNVTINAGDGRDEIYNDSSKITIDGGAGNDYIDNNNSFVSIGGGEGADSILNSGSYVTIDAGEGNDSIDNGGASSTIYGGAGADSILNSNNNVVIYGGDDNDSIRNESSAVSINGGAGNDSIYNNNYGENVLINGNAGDDYISNAAINVLIAVGAGNNSVDNTARNVTVETGAGNDTINNSSDNLLVRYGGGSDIIDGFNSTSTLQTSSSITNALSNGNDVFLTIDNNTVTLKNYGNSNRVNIKYGDEEATELQLTMIIQGTDLSETIRNENDAATIQALAGHDTVDNYGGAVSIDAGAGNDSIRNNNNNSNPLNSNVTIDAGDGADFIYNEGANALINGGADDDTVENYGAATSIIGGGGRDSVYNESSSVMIDGGEDGDIINNAGSTTSISAGAGNDSIRNTNSNVTIDSGAGADSIDNRSENVTIDGGEGTDSITNNSNNVSINGGAGVDSIFNYSGNNVTIDTGEDDDIVYNETSNVLIIATQGSNSINSNSGDNVTIRTGAGNDTVRNNGDNFLIQYGGGSDIINGFNSSSTLQILTDNTIDSVISDGTNSTLTIGDNNLVLNNVGIGSSLNIQYGENSDVETFAIPNVITVNSGYYSNSISNVTISGTDSGDTVRNEGANSYINLGEGADSVYNYYTASVSIDVGVGDDTVYNTSNSNNSYINLGEGNNSIYNGAALVSIEAGAGDDTVNNNGSNSYINLGEGNDSIYNGASGVTIDAGAGSDSITVNNNYSSINGGADDDLISISSGNNTIVGGTGNDTIYNNSNGNLIQYAEGDGNDYIELSTSSSTLQITSGTIDSASTNGRDLFLTVGQNTISLINGVRYDTNIIDAEGNEISLGSFTNLNGTDGGDSISNYISYATINVLGGDDTIYNYASNVLIQYTGGNDFIHDESSYSTVQIAAGTVDTITTNGKDLFLTVGQNTVTVENPFSYDTEIIDANGNAISFDEFKTINGTDGDDSIENYISYATINALGGNDTIYNNDGYGVIIDAGAGDDSIYNEGYNATNSTIDGGAGSDSISGYFWSTSISGGADDDLVSINNNDNTISGGTGDDTIYISGSSNIFQYARGDGNDYISGFNSASSLQITSGTVDTITTDKTNIFVAVGNGTITLANATTLSNINIFKPDGSLAKFEFLIEGTDGDDSIRNSVYSAAIDALGGNDTIRNYAYYASINGGAGADSILNYRGSNVTIDAGAGNDTVNNHYFGDYSYINLGDGNDYIYSEDEDYSTIDGGAGSDSISGSYWSLSINGGADDDLISIVGGGDNNTINGGTGNDTIYNNISYGILYQYAEGDGNDYIEGFTSNSTLQITSGTVNTITTDGTNTFVAIGNNTITIADFTDIDALNLVEEDTLPAEGTDEDDFIQSTVSGATINGYGGDDTIINGSVEGSSIVSGGGDDVLINGGSGNDSISNYVGEAVTINGGADDDYISNVGLSALLNGDDDNDTIISAGVDVSINGGAGDDVLYNSGASSIIDGGDGEDFIGNTSSFVTVNAGADDDYVINEGGSGVYISASSGNNYIDNTGENVTIDTGDGNDTINSMSQNVSIDAGAGNNAIYISDNNNTLYLGDGNNTITVGENVTTMTIRDFGSGDVIILPEAVDSVEEVNNVGVIAGNATIRGLNTTAEEMRWTFNDNVATYAQNRFVNLVLSEDGKSIVQGSGRNSTIIGEPVVTIGGVASTDGFDVDFDNNVITISESALNRSDITASAGFTFKFEDIERNDSRQDWLIDGTTATFVNITTVEKYYLEEDNSQIIYDTNSEMEPVVTVNGVVSTDGLSISGDTVTVKLSSLSQNSTVTISDGYYLALGEDVPRIQSYDYAGWRLNGNTATYIDGMTEEGYVLENNRISYTMTGDGEVLVTVSGVKNTAGLALDAENKIVTVEQSALNQSNVTISDGYTLAFTDIETATTQSARWTFDNNTATYINTTSKEIYTLEDNQIVYRTISTEDILVTVEGVTSTDGLAIDTVNKVVTVSTDSLSQDSMVTVSNGYTLALDSNITPAQIQNTDWNMRGSNAYGTIFFGTAGYLLANNQIRYATTDKTENVVVFNVASTDGLSFDGTTVTVSKASLNKNTVRISGGYTLKLGNDVDIPYRAEEDWSYDSDNSNAIYTSSTRTEGYQLVNNQIMYVAEKPGEDVTISGLANSEGINLDGDTFIIPESALSQHNTATILNEGYKLSLAEGVTKSARSLEGWKLQDGTAIYTTDSTTAGYKLANNKITYEDEIIADTLVAVEGVTSRNGLEIDKENKIVAVYGEALNGNDIAISGDYDYKLQLADSNRAVKDNSGWLKENNKFSYQAGVLSDGYKLSDSGKNLTYIAEEKGNIAAVLDGVRKAPTFKPVEEGEPTVIQITEDNFADDELSILSNGGEYQFEISGDFNAGKQFSGSEISDTVTNSSDITIDLGAGGDSLVNSASGISISGGAGNDKIYNSGSAVSILGGKGNDNVTVSGDNSDHNIFLYHMDSGKDKLINLGRTDSIKIADSVAPEVTTNISGNDIIFNIGGGAIKIKDGLTSNVAINMIDSEKNPVDAISGNNYTTEGVIKNDTIKLKSDLEKEYKADNVSTVDGSQLEEGISINAGLEGTSILGGVGRDTLLSGSKDFTFKGGNGNDVFVYNGEVNGRIEDYSISGKPGKDKVSIDWDKLKEYNIITGNLELTFEGETEDKTLTIDKVNNTNITFLLNGTTKTKVSSFNDDAIFSSKSKLAEIGHNPNSKRNNAVFDGTQYSKVVTIDASEANYEVNIIGNKKANLITAGSDGSTINGKKGKDTLVGGAESDIFVYEKNSGNKVIRNYEYDASGGDVVSLQGGVKITAINDDNKGNRILSVGKNKITLEGGASLEAFKFDDGTEKIAKDGMLINLVDGKETSISLTTSFSTDSIDLSGKDWINLDASEFNKGLTITGNTQANSLIGSNGNNTIHGGSGNNFINGGAGDDELWGEDGANTFIFNPGNGTDTIKDFNASLDKILIQDTNGRAVNFKGKYNSSKDTLTLTVNGGGKVILTGLAENLEDGQSVEDLTFNINGSHKISGKKLK